jgi:ABC-type lipoprotein release transport system permease subunit
LPDKLSAALFCILFEIGAHLPILEKLIKNIDYWGTILDIKFISKLGFALIFALLACYIPSRAAGALDPADGLREE